MTPEDLKAAVELYKDLTATDETTVTERIIADGYSAEDAAEIVKSIDGEKASGDNSNSHAADLGIGAGNKKEAAEPAASELYNIYNVEATRKDGKPEIVGYKVKSLEKKLPMTAAEVKMFNGFDIAIYGQRASLATLVAGDEFA